jgi:site-specific recombinase XerD
MCPKMPTEPSVHSTFDALQYAYNFLFYMTFIRSMSLATIRSYQNDLCQAFELEFTALNMPAMTPESSDGRPKHGLRALSHELEVKLLETCRAAQSRWSPLAPSSRNRKAACLKSFLNWMYSESLIERELAHQIHGPKVPHRLPHYISVDEAFVLLESLRSAHAAAQTEAARIESERRLVLVLLLYGGGLRVSEACGLEWKTIDLKGRLVRVTGKGDKERIVALPTLVASLLEKAHSREAYVFGQAPLDTRTAYEMVRSAGAQAGLIRPLHPHALRHSFATHLLSSGANLRALQELLGHQTLQATQRYTHLSIDQLARTMESFHPLGVGEKPPIKKK